MPPNFFPSPVLNSTLQTPLQHGVPSSLTASQSSTMSLLSALQDDKLGLILPVLVRMEHKMDQIMALLGAKSSAGINVMKMESELNPAMTGNQSSAAMTGNLSSAGRVENQSNASVMGNQLPFSMTGKQSNPATMGNKSNSTLAGNRLNEGNQSNAITIENQSNTDTNAPQSNPTAMETSTSSTVNTNLNASLTEDDTLEENQGDTDVVMEPSAETAKQTTPSGTGKSTAQGRAMQHKMAKISENTLPNDLNFPISRDNIIALQAKSTSTMNFAVRLMREMFTLDELEGKNIAGARGKDRVDPNRVEIIKDIVFQVYRTSPSDRDYVWRCCRKAMDSFMRRMKRERVLKNKLAVVTESN